MYLVNRDERSGALEKISININNDSIQRTLFLSNKFDKNWLCWRKLRDQSRLHDRIISIINISSIQCFLVTIVSIRKS